MKLTEEQQAFATENHNLIYSFAISANVAVEDYYDVLAIGFCKAVIGYKNSKSKFSTYAYVCMRNELYQTYRKENKYTKEIPIDEDYAFTDDCKIEDKELDLINVANIKSLVQTLPKKEQEIVRLRLLGYSQYRIAEKLGLSQSDISRRLKNIRIKYERMRVSCD